MEFIKIDGKPSDMPLTFLSGRPFLASLIFGALSSVFATLTGTDAWICLSCWFLGTLGSEIARRPS